MDKPFQQNIAKKIGDYQLLALIDKGANGNVYKGLQSSTAKIIAIKQVSKQNMKPFNLVNLKREIGLLKRLKHKHIVKYLDFISSENDYNIILEYVENGSMRQLIKHITLTEDLTAYYIRQVLSGLIYLHN
jgi:serine/threonine protein kinase